MDNTLPHLIYMNIKTSIHNQKNLQYTKETFRVVTQNVHSNNTCPFHFKLSILLVK